MPEINGKQFTRPEFEAINAIGVRDDVIVSQGGFYNQASYVMTPAKDLDVQISLERALEPMVVRLNGEPGMWENPMGPKTIEEYDGGSVEGVLASIQGFFTAGVSNTGANLLTVAETDAGKNQPQNHTHIPLFPLHGKFSQTSPNADSIQREAIWKKDDLWKTGIEQTEDDLFYRVSGVIPQRNMVLPYDIDVHRTVESKAGEYGFTVIDTLKANRDSGYMWLYHPNFNIGEGDELHAPITKLYARDKDAEVDIENWGKMTGIGDELAERCYITNVKGSDGIEGLEDGTVIVAKVAEDRESGIYVQYNLNDFFEEQRCLHIWKNTQAGVLGIEPGSTFNGRNWAEEHKVLSRLEAGEDKTYRVKVGFMMNKAEVQEKLDLIDKIRGEDTTKIIRIGDEPLHSAYMKRAS